MDTTAHWVEVSYVCEQVDGKYNTGSIIITERDNNPGSATYNTTRTRTETGDARCVRNENPDWSEESYVCEQDGEGVTPDWREISYTCEQSDGENTGTAIVVEQDMNQNSPTYGQQRTVYELDTERCPLPTPVYNFKVKTTTLGGTETTVNCNGNTTLSASEITDSYCVSAIVGGCVTVIGEGAFQNYSRLSDVTISNSVETIGEHSFDGCTSLSNITIGNSVTTIGNYAFKYCVLTSVEIPNSVTSIGSYAFQTNTGLRSITIPDSVTKIGQSAFASCTSLTSVTIGSGVTSIGYYAFQGCSSLTSITCLKTTPPNLGSNAFSGTNNAPIYVPAASLEKYKNAYNWSGYASRIKAIPNS